MKSLLGKIRLLHAKGQAKSMESHESAFAYKMYQQTKYGTAQGKLEMKDVETIRDTYDKYFGGH